MAELSYLDGGRGSWGATGETRARSTNTETCGRAFTLTSSLAMSSCSSSISLRAVSSWFCLSSDWPIRAASSRSRSFCRDETKEQNIQFLENDHIHAHGVAAFPPPPSHLLQQVGDRLDVMIGLGDLAHSLRAQHCWGQEGVWREAGGQKKNNGVLELIHLIISLFVFLFICIVQNMHRANCIETSKTDVCVRACRRSGNNLIINLIYDVLRLKPWCDSNCKSCNSGKYKKS